MRPTLHDYVIDKYNSSQDNSIDRLANFAICYRFAKLTNRAPLLGDFVPCDEDGNVLDKPNPYDYEIEANVKCSGWGYLPDVDGNARYYDMAQYQLDMDKYQAAQDRVIFAGDWEVIDQDLDWTQIRSKELKLDIEWSGNECDVTVWDSNWNTCDYLSANRIEDLPRDIEFKDGVV